MGSEGGGGRRALIEDMGEWEKGRKRERESGRFRGKRKNG
jgi:hypothetical protein